MPNPQKLYPEDVQAKLDAIFGEGSVVKPSPMAFKVKRPLVINCQSPEAAKAVAGRLRVMGVDSRVGGPNPEKGPSKFVSVLFTEADAERQMDIIEKDAVALQALLKNPPPLSAPEPKARPDLALRPITIFAPEEMALARSSMDEDQKKASLELEEKAEKLGFIEQAIFTTKFGIDHFDKGVWATIQADPQNTKSKDECLEGLQAQLEELKQRRRESAPLLREILLNVDPQASDDKLVKLWEQAFETRQSELPAESKARMLDPATHAIVTLDAREVMRRLHRGQLNRLGPATVWDDLMNTHFSLTEGSLQKLREQSSPQPYTGIT